MPINYRKISIERLHQCLSYIPDTGEFIHKPRIGNDRGAKIFNSQWAGKPAGTRRHDGHIFIVVDAYRLPAARVAWAMFYGEWPEGEIHHRDGDPSCNSINNLKKVEQSNNTSGHRGVSWHQERQKWRARIKINGKEILLGRFTNKEDAIAAYEAAAAKYHGEYRSV